nr:beta parvin [Hymenolepis microstoma]
MNMSGLSETGTGSFFSKLETLRSKNKKRSRKEVEDLTAEGRKAMESALCSLAIEDPENYMLEEGQERSIIERASMESPEVKELIASLISWINDELINHRILVRNIADDLYDGQILQNLAEKLAGIKLEHPEVTQSEFGQMQRLKEVVATINQLLGVPESWAREHWSAELIHNKDVIAVIRLVVAMAKHFKSGIRLPDGVYLTVIVVRKINGILEYRYEKKYLTVLTQPLPESETTSHPLDYLPNRHLVPKLIICFVNEYLQKINLQVKDLKNDFSDGVRLVLLMGLLEGYFVPLHCYHLNPANDAQKLANVRLAFDLMRAAELPEPSERPEDIMLAEDGGKSILRLLYGLLTHYHYEQLGRGNNALADLQRIAEDSSLLQSQQGEFGNVAMNRQSNEEVGAA